MNESERLALEFDRALNGGAWHGPSWREALEGVEAASASARPIPGAHSIGEIVRHAGLWMDVVRRRLEGETPQVPDEVDWRAGEFPDEGAWRAAVDESLANGRALVETVRRFPAGKLHEMRPRVDATWYELVSGELQHILYHAGQVAVLRKAGVPARQPS
jgi:hypothetical protein